MNRTRKRIAAASLSLAMLVGMLAGCTPEPAPSSTPESSAPESSAAASGSESRQEAAEGGEETVITIWNKDVLAPGIQSDAISDAIAAATGVRLEVINGDAQKFKVLMAGGDLPEILHTNYNDQGVDFNTLLQSGQLLPLDDLIDRHAPNIKGTFPGKLDYSKEFLSNDGQVYFVPIQLYKGDPENPMIAASGGDVTLYTRYDLYKAIGSPEIKTEDDYLNALKAMQEHSPQTDTGKKAYALSGFSDWGLWMYTIPYPIASGWQPQGYNVLYNVIDLEADSMYYSDVFWNSVRFWNKAYNMGIVDPEMFTQKHENYIDKLKEGQSFVAYATWIAVPMNQEYVAQGKPEMGFEIIPTGLPVLQGLYASDAPFGWGREYAMALSANCKDPQKAMEFLNFCYSEEAARLLNSGVEGVHWEKVNGVPQMTESFYTSLNSDPNYLSSQGFHYSKLMGLASNQMLSDGYPADLRRTNAEKAKLAFPIDLEMIADLGVEATYAGEAIAARQRAGDFTVATKFDLTPSLITEPSDETKTVMSTVDELMKVSLAQVVMASPENFEAEKEKAIAEIEAKGYAAAAEEMMRIYAQAAETAKSFTYAE